MILHCIMFEKYPEWIQKAFRVEAPLLEKKLKTNIIFVYKLGQHYWPLMSEKGLYVPTFVAHHQLVRKLFERKQTLIELTLLNPKMLPYVAQKCSIVEQAFHFRNCIPGVFNL